MDSPSVQVCLIRCIGEPDESDVGSRFQVIGNLFVVVVVVVSGLISFPLCLMLETSSRCGWWQTMDSPVNSFASILLLLLFPELFYLLNDEIPNV